MKGQPPDQGKNQEPTDPNERAESPMSRYFDAPSQGVYGSSQYVVDHQGGNVAYGQMNPVYVPDHPFLIPLAGSESTSNYGKRRGYSIQNASLYGKGPSDDSKVSATREVGKGLYSRGKGKKSSQHPDLGDSICSYGDYHYHGVANSAAQVLGRGKGSSKVVVPPRTQHHHASSSSSSSYWEPNYNRSMGNEASRRGDYQQTSSHQTNGSPSSIVNHDSHSMMETRGQARGNDEGMWDPGGKIRFSKSQPADSNGEANAFAEGPKAVYIDLSAMIPSTRMQNQMPHIDF